MDGHGFDNLVRALIGSRRSLLSGALVVAAGWLGVGEATARKRRKNTKRKKVTPNAFGCLDVGQLCRGNTALCCSGVCGGKKPKQGEKDKRRCIGHNVGGCTPDRNLCVTNSALRSLCNPTVTTSVCFLTTGDAGFCGNVSIFEPEVSCQLCVRDADCETAGFPPGSACVVLDPQGDLCGDACAATENRACFLPGI